MKYRSNINRIHNYWNRFGIVWDIFLCYIFSCGQQVKVTNYQREKILDPRNTHEKNFWTHEISTRKNFEPTRRPREKFRTHEITTRINLWHGNTHEVTMVLWHSTHKAHDSMQPTKFSTLLRTCSTIICNAISNSFSVAVSL